MPDQFFGQATCAVAHHCKAIRIHGKVVVLDVVPVDGDGLFKVLVLDRVRGFRQVVDQAWAQPFTQPGQAFQRFFGAGVLMIKIYKAGVSLAKRLDVVQAEYLDWYSIVQKAAEVFGAFGHVTNSRGEVIA